MLRIAMLHTTYYILLFCGAFFNREYSRPGKQLLKGGRKRNSTKTIKHIFWKDSRNHGCRQIAYALIIASERWLFRYSLGVMPQIFRKLLLNSEKLPNPNSIAI